MPSGQDTQGETASGEADGEGEVCDPIELPVPPIKPKYDHIHEDTDKI